MKYLKNIITSITLATVSMLLVTTAEAKTPPAAKHSPSNCKASWYGGKHHMRKTASGKVFNMYGFTTASNSHKMGTKLKVTNLANNKSVNVTVTDTGGFGKYGICLDLSRGAFNSIANLKSGIIKVKYEVIK